MLNIVWLPKICHFQASFQFKCNKAKLDTSPNQRFTSTFETDSFTKQEAQALFCCIKLCQKEGRAADVKG